MHKTTYWCHVFIILSRRHSKRLKIQKNFWINLLPKPSRFVCITKHRKIHKKARKKFKDNLKRITSREFDKNERMEWERSSLVFASMTSMTLGWVEIKKTLLNGFLLCLSFFFVKFFTARNENNLFFCCFCFCVRRWKICLCFNLNGN